MRDGRPDREEKQSVCRRCGKPLSAPEKAGSLTGYLFQDTRCRCAEDEAFDAASMSQKFWKLKASGELVASREDMDGGKGRARVNLAAGAIIAGVYEIRQLIGRGGMGEVYLAKHTALGKRCALKVIPPEQVTEVGWQRFQIEAKLFSHLDHINLVRVMDLGIHDGCLPFYAMDYVDGQTLSDLIAEQGRLKLKDVLEIFLQVCDGVDFAHRHGIIHRDLKPANIMTGVDRSDKTLVKILDFGLAKLSQHDRAQQSLTAAGDVFGSPFYMSPEQCSGEKIDSRSDIYSIGCTLYECLCERPPFVGNIAQAIMNAHEHGQPPSLAAAVGEGIYPDGMEVIVAKLLRKNPAERYQTMAELKGDLEKVTRGEEVAPVYVSRAKAAEPPVQLPAESPPSLRADKAVSNDKSFSPLLAGILCALALLCGLAYLAINTILKQASSPMVGHNSIQLLPSPEREIMVRSKVRDASYKWDGKPFYQGIEEANGGKVKVWKFPLLGDDCPATITAFAEKRRPISSAAQGTVRLPAQALICLFPQVTMAKVPQFIDGLSDGNIDHLKFTDFSGETFMAICPKFCKLKSVTGLSVVEVDRVPGLGEELIKLANNFPLLTKLVMDGLDDGRMYRKIKSLKQLEILEALGLENHADDFYEAISGSQQLRSVKMVDLPVTAVAVKALATCSNLESVVFHRTLGEDETRLEDLLALTRLKNLEVLSVSTIKYSDELVDVVKQFKHLLLFRFEYSGRWSAKQMMNLRRAIPLCRINAVEQGEQLLEHNYPALMRQMKVEDARGR